MEIRTENLFTKRRNPNLLRTGKFWQELAGRTGGPSLSSSLIL